MEIDQQLLQEWLGSAPGRLLADAECAALQRRLGDLFGYHMLEVSALGCMTHLSGVTRISHYVSVAPQAGAVPAEVVGSPSRLPIASDSIAAVLLHHTLDFTPDPHQVLRESERVLIPEGRLIIVGFNPWSLWGLVRLIHRRRQTVPWNGNFLSMPRVNDWLSLLGFDVESTDLVMFRPPFAHEGLMRRLQFMESVGRRAWPVLAGVYVVRAVKRVSTLTPLEPLWKRRTRLLRPGVIEPTTRSLDHG
jgi:SAM-dependent methyltransferase